MWNATAQGRTMDEVARRGIRAESKRSDGESAFCRDRGLRDSLFYDWKKRIREGEAAKFVE